MWKDPIVEEIHAVRRQIAIECNHDIRQIVERLREKEKRHKGRLTFPKHGVGKKPKAAG